MATDQVTNTTSAPAVPGLQAWLARLGISGKLMAIGGLVGVLAVFLPLLSMSVQMPGIEGGHGFGRTSIQINGVSTSQSVQVIENWRGVICLIGYIAALALAYALYLPNGLAQKSFYWAGAGTGAVVALLAVWLLILASNGSSNMAGLFKVSVGFGAILNVLAAGAVAAGGFLKAREEKLI